MTKSGTTMPNTGDSAMDVILRRLGDGWNAYGHGRVKSPHGPCEVERESGVYWWREIQPDKGKEHGEEKPQA